MSIVKTAGVLAITTYLEKGPRESSLDFFRGTGYDKLNHGAGMDTAIARGFEISMTWS